MENRLDVVRRLTCWKSAIEITEVKGGITNANFRVDAGHKSYFVRTGTDIPHHGIMRFNELEASRAAATCGLSPKLIHHEPGALVLEFIHGKTLTPEDARHSDRLNKITDLLRLCHSEMKHHIRGPALIFWVFHVIRDYGHRLTEIRSRSLSHLPRLLQSAERLEQAVGAVEIVYGHNDLLSANFLDDGKRIWLVDWDYAGFNSPLFDLANLCSNNGIEGDAETRFLESYYKRTPPEGFNRQYAAMKAASLLREALWSMVSEHYSGLDFDYVAYTQDYLGRFEDAYNRFLEIEG